METRSVKQILALSAHFEAIRETEFYLRDQEIDKLPWGSVTQVTSGSMWRLGIPIGFNITAELQGFTFKWSEDFEALNPAHSGATEFDRNRFREVVRRLPSRARRQCIGILADEILPKLAERTEEYRRALNHNADSEGVVRELIVFCESEVA